LVENDAEANAAALRKLDFEGTTVTDPAITETAVGVGAGAATSTWKSFQVGNCVLTSITMTCTNWVAATGKEADGGYQRWDAGIPVAFWWFDGRDLSDTTAYPTASFPKIRTGPAELKMSVLPITAPESSTTLGVTLLSFVAALISLSF